MIVFLNIFWGKFGDLKNESHFTVIVGKFKFQVQDSFLEYIFLEIWRFEKRITLSEKSHLQGAFGKIVFNFNQPNPVTFKPRRSSKTGVMELKAALCGELQQPQSWEGRNAKRPQSQKTPFFCIRCSLTNSAELINQMESLFFGQGHSIARYSKCPPCPFIVKGHVP